MTSCFQSRLSHLRFTVGRALIHLGLRALPPGRVRSELYMLLDGWATQVRVRLKAHDLGRGAHKPSVEAIRWAERQADDVAASPPRHLNLAQEAAFRQRLFVGTRRRHRDDDDQEKTHD